MNELSKSLTVLGRPYSVTKSRLGATTKVYEQQFVCDLDSLRELFESVAEKLSPLAQAGEPEFSFLISFDDKTHQDGVVDHLAQANRLATGKKTERVVLRWSVEHEIDGEPNELTVTVRVSNPINPLIFLQAALSKSPSDLDNFQFEMGSTCVTVDGAGQTFSDEVFYIVQKWIDARNKPHAFVGLHNWYLKYEWLVDQVNYSLLPFLIVSALSSYVYLNYETQAQIALVPIILAVFHLLRTGANAINTKMAHWARRAGHLSLFQITNGDNDAITKLAASAKNGVIKLAAAGISSFVINVASGICVWWLLST